MDYSKAKNKDIMRDLCDRIKVIAGQLYAMEKDNPKIAAELDMYFRDLSDIESTARAYILYSLEKVGTQKGFLRARASRENGKKGGRPPKRITELKKQIEDLESELDEITERHLSATDTAGKAWTFDEQEKTNTLQRLKGELYRLEQERQKAQDKES